jgi:glycerol-3-phosphate acyltransferase PlsY
VSAIFNGSPLATGAACVVVAYLIGAIPFGYLITYAVKGIDIRTVGSGNLGATNVGRTLGFRYFLLVFVLDMLKGYLPTLRLPLAASRLAGLTSPDLPVLVGLATILGHTFPIYLKFRGGKGVATSVGAVLALDPLSCGASVVTFAVVLFLARYVSLAALVGGLAFSVAHFARQDSPFRREHIAMSLFSIAIVALLVGRHRSNLKRIWNGTEPKVNFTRGAKDRESTHDRSGRTLLLVVVGLAAFALVVAGGYQVYRQIREPVAVSAGPWTLRETDRAMTGQQRVDRVAFVAHGTRLAATCPRYDRLVIYSVLEAGKLNEIRDIQLEGRPVALATLGDRFLVLETPTGDQRHVEPGWWETFDSDGKRVGGRHLAGFYPDDLAVTPDGKYLLLVTSGKAEGDPKKPMPALEVIAVDFKSGTDQVVGRVTFLANDDPCRLAVSAEGRCAAVLLTRTNQTLAIDLADPASPKVVGRIKPQGSLEPYVSYSPDADWIMMPVASQSEGIAIKSPRGPGEVITDQDGARMFHVDYLVCTRHQDSVLELFQTEPRTLLGRLPLKGPLNLGRTRPTGLAYTRDRGLLAVATRSGTIHMIEMVPRSGPTALGSEPIAAANHDAGRVR